LVKINEDGKKMKWLLNLFTEHPRSIGETYWQHFCVASRLSARLSIACSSQLAHAVFPFIKPPFGSDVNSLMNLLQEVNPQKRSTNNVDYEDLDDLFGAD